MSFYDKMRAKTIKQSFKNPFFKNIRNIKINKAYGGNKAKNNLTL
ncbi:hypothetical protein ckin74_05850 [Helicobacter pylori]